MRWGEMPWGGKFIKNLSSWNLHLSFCIHLALPQNSLYRDLIHGIPYLFLQCPPALDDRNSLTSNGGEASALTAGLLVHLDIDTSTPDTYQSPPAPLPFDFILGLPGSIASESVGDTIGCNGCKNITFCSDDQESKTFHLDSSHVTQDMLELPKSKELSESAKEEDVCTICLEGEILCLWDITFSYTCVLII